MGARSPDNNESRLTFVLSTESAARLVAVTAPALILREVTAFFPRSGLFTCPLTMSLLNTVLAAKAVPVPSAMMRARDEHTLANVSPLSILWATTGLLREGANDDTPSTPVKRPAEPVLLRIDPGCRAVQTRSRFPAGRCPCDYPADTAPGNDRNPALRHRDRS